MEYAEELFSKSKEERLIYFKGFTDGFSMSARVSTMTPEEILNLHNTMPTIFGEAPKHLVDYCAEKTKRKSWPWYKKFIFGDRAPIPDIGQK